jgi:hypothetical protein
MHSSVITQLLAFAFSTTATILSSPSYVQLIYVAQALFTGHTISIFTSFHGRALFAVHFTLVLFVSCTNATFAPLLSFAVIWLCGIVHVCLAQAILKLYEHDYLDQDNGEVGEEGVWE